MASRLEIIYDIKEYLKAYSDDIELADEHIMFMYRKKRARDLRRLLNDYTRKFDKSVLQNLCIGLEEVDKTLCGLNVNCRIMRSSAPIPSLLDLRSRSSLVTVGPSLVAAETFKIISDIQAPFILSKPYSSGIYTYIDTDGYIYLLSNDDAHLLLECVYITGLFEDPEELTNYSNCCNCDTTEPCFTEDSEYPIQGFLLDSISTEIKNELVQRYNIPEDKVNNSDEDKG